MGPVMQPMIDSPILLPGVGDAVLRLAAATVVGVAVGLNRELHDKPAGVRTHGLVALGSALVTLVSVHYAYAGPVHDGNAVTRTIQGIIAGVGFLGGGVILKTSDRGTVHGLTTAATIWLVACFGITTGAGLWMLTGVAFAFTLAVLVLGGPFEQWARRRMVGRRALRAGARRRRTDRDAARTEAQRKAQREADDTVTGMPPGVG